MNFTGAAFTSLSLLRTSPDWSVLRVIAPPPARHSSQLRTFSPMTGSAQRALPAIDRDRRTGRSMTGRAAARLGGVTPAERQAGRRDRDGLRLVGIIIADTDRYAACPSNR